MIKDIIGVPNPIKYQEGGELEKLTEKLKKLLEQSKKPEFVNNRPIPGVPIVLRINKIKP